MLSGKNANYFKILDFYPFRHPSRLLFLFTKQQELDCPKEA